MESPSNNNNFDIIFESVDYKNFIIERHHFTAGMTEKQKKTLYVENFVGDPKNITTASDKLLSKMRIFLTHNNEYESSAYGKNIKPAVKEQNNKFIVLLIKQIDQELVKRTPKKGGGKRKTKTNKSKKTKK